MNIKLRMHIRQLVRCKRTFVWPGFIMLLVVALGLSSCAFYRMKKETESLKSQWVLIARVHAAHSENGPLYAVVYEMVGSKPRVYSIRHVTKKLSKFAFLLEPGDHDYRVAVFHDHNDDLIIDQDEPVAWLNNGNRLRFSEVTTWLRKRVSMKDAVPLSDSFPRDLASISAKDLNKFHIAVGEIANLSEARFSAEEGIRGLWEPHWFLRKYGIGIYMLEPYDPKRIPVLFVSGASGNIHNWDYFLSRLDRTRFQPWYYLYPSGVRIFRLGGVLRMIADELKQSLGFDSMVVIAHSMGGLVSRELVTQQSQKDNMGYVSHFFSISTPWNGHTMAKSGVNNLSTPVSSPIPSWHDVVPGSRFLQSVFSQPIGKNVHYHLLFSYLPDTSGDGSVELSSQLLPEAQIEAESIRGFEAEHVEILSRDDVFEYVAVRLPSPLIEETDFVDAGISDAGN